MTPEAWIEDPTLWKRLLHPEDADRVLAASAAADRQGSEFHELYRALTADGRVLWVRDDSVPVARDEHGRPTLMQGVMFDVTEQKASQDLLQEAEARFRTIVERVPTVAYTWDAADAPGTAPARYISPQIERLLGYRPQEWIDDPTLWTRRIHPEDLDEVILAWDSAVATADAFSAEYRIRTADDRWVWLRDEAVPVGPGSRGRPIYQGVMIDVTEPREAQDRLQEAEERYRTLVEQVPVVVYVDAVDEVSTAWYVSPRYERLTGYTAEQRLEEPSLWVRMLHPEDRERTLAESARTNATGDPFDVEYRILRADGRVVWVHDQAYVVDTPEGRAWQGVMIDVTQRRLAEEALGRRDRILEAAAFAAERFLTAAKWTDGIDEVLERLGRGADAGRAYVYENGTEADGAKSVTLWHEWAAEGGGSGISGDSHVGVRYGDVGFSRWEATLSVGGVIHGPVATYPDQERALLEPRGIRSCIVAPVFVDDEWWGYVGFDHEEERAWQPAEIGAVRVAADTLGAAIARERDAARLSEAEERYRTLIETIPAATYVDTVDAISQALYMSPQVERIYGYTPEEWRSQPHLWEAGLHPDDRDRVVASVERHNLDGSPYQAEYRFRHRDGRWVWVHDEAVMLTDEDGRPRFSQGVIYDITEQKQQEERLRDAEERFRAIVEHVPSAIYVDRADPSMESHLHRATDRGDRGCDTRGVAGGPGALADPHGPAGSRTDPEHVPRRGDRRRALAGRVSPPHP